MDRIKPLSSPVVDRNKRPLQEGQQVRVHNDEGYDAHTAKVVRIENPPTPTGNHNGFWVDIDCGDGPQGMPSYCLEVLPITRPAEDPDAKQPNEPDKLSSGPATPQDGEAQQSSRAWEEVEMLAAENVRLRRAGAALCQAAIRVASEYDGLHRMMLAVSEFTKVMANEHGRGDREEQTDE
jgi:hypothetical protein